MTSNPPERYVELQKAYNSCHSNGRAENEEDLQAMCAVRLAAQRKIFGLESFLDVGCRMGYATHRLMLEAPGGKRFVGVDVVPEFVEYANANHPGDFMVADAHELPFGDGEFDALLCTQVLEHCYDFDRAVKEVLRVTKKVAYLGVPLEPDTEESRRANPSHHVFEPDTLRWLNRLVLPGWELVWCQIIGEQRYFDMMLVRKGP